MSMPLSPGDLLQKIVTLLFAADENRLQSWIDRLCRQNQEAEGLEDPIGFIYAGIYYRPTWLGRGKFDRPVLSLSLWSSMDAFLKDKTIVDRERQFIVQSLHTVLSGCESTSDARDALPEAVVHGEHDAAAVRGAAAAGRL